jgi:hypothetical protein
VGLVIAFHALEVVGESTLGLRVLIAHDGPLGLVHITLAEQLVHA